VSVIIKKDKPGAHYMYMEDHPEVIEKVPHEYLAKDVMALHLVLYDLDC
jgi:hypothetical protein